MSTRNQTILLAGATLLYWSVFWLGWLGQDLNAFSRNTIAGFTVGTWAFCGLVAGASRWWHQRKTQTKPHNPMRRAWIGWSFVMLIATLLFWNINQ